VELGAVSLSHADVVPFELDAPTFERLARAAMTGLVAPVEHPPAGKLTVEASLVSMQDGGAQLGLSAGLRLVGIPFRIEIQVIGRGQASDEETTHRLSTSALADLRTAVARHLTLVEAQTERLVRGLNAAEADEQLLCARLLGLRRDKSAIVALGTLLGDPREAVADTAAEALVEIGDQAAVPVLISGIRRGDLRSEVRAIEAMARLGGKEARAYLEMTAQGHPHPEVQSLSRSWLQRMDQAKRR
jgi:hypothetical protein